MKPLYFILPCAVLLFAGCGSSGRMQSSSNPPLAHDAEVGVIELNSPAPLNLTPIGQIKTEYSEQSPCRNYEQTVMQAQERSREKGGNLIRITKHVTPHTMASWHKVWADVYRIPDEELVNYRAPEPEFDQALFDEGCAIIYFYRGRNAGGALIDYNVRIGEEIVWRARHNDKEWIKIKAEGPICISAKTESRTDLDLVVEPGRSYYVKCGIGMGFFVGRPILEQINESTGKYEFEQIIKKD